MTRTDNDTWDLASSVGITAPMVAAARAVATRRRTRSSTTRTRLPLSRSGGIDLLARLATGELSPADLDSGDTQIEIAIRRRDGRAHPVSDDFFATPPTPVSGRR